MEVDSFLNSEFLCGECGELQPVPVRSVSRNPGGYCKKLPGDEPMKNSFSVAHRGFSGIYPENTRLAFEKALEPGVDCIELDVRETRDGEIVVMHDPTVERTTDGRGRVEDLTLEEINKLDAGKWKGAFEGAGVPSLDETLRFAAGRTMLLIEIKEASPEKVIKLARKHRMEENVIIGSFNMDCLLRTRRNAPGISTALITDKIPESPDILIEAGIRILDVHYSEMFSPRLKAFLHRGIVCGAWTVDDPGEMKELLKSGFGFITTNRPDVLGDLIRQ